MAIVEKTIKNSIGDGIKRIEMTSGSYLTSTTIPKGSTAKWLEKRNIHFSKDE